MDSQAARSLRSRSLFGSLTVPSCKQARSLVVFSTRTTTFIKRSPWFSVRGGILDTISFPPGRALRSSK